MDTAVEERRTIISKMMLLIGQLDLSNNDSIDYVYADLDLSSDSSRISPQVCI